MYAKLPAIALLPPFVEIHDHGVLAAVAITELVEVLFVKTSWFIQSIMELVPRLYLCSRYY